MHLVIINGSPAAGKSTVASRLHADMPLSLLADVDAWRRLISGWRENRKESLALTYAHTVAAVGAHLKAGQSVIVDKAILHDNGVLDALVSQAEEVGATVHEFILTADLETIKKRAEERGYGDPDLLTPQWTEEFWHWAQDTIAERTSAIVIDTSTLSQEEVYEAVKAHLVS